MIGKRITVALLACLLLLASPAHAAFTVAIGAATTATGESGGTVTLGALPTHAAGDLLLVIHHVKDDLTATISSGGWTSLATVDHSTNQRLSVFYKWAASSSETPPGVTTTNFRRSTVLYGMKLSGAVGSGSPLDVAAATTGATAATGTGPWIITAPTLTPVTNGCAILRLFSTRDNNLVDNNSEGTKLAFGSGYETTDTGGSSMGSSWFEQATAGATGTATMEETVNGPDNFISMTLAIKPAAGGGGGSAVSVISSVNPND